MKETLEILVKKASSGDKRSLDQVITQISDMVYNLSLKMLLYPEDAKDATQEILVKVITHLSTFKHESKFTTWVYRIATNYLLTLKGKKAQSFSVPFEAYEVLIDTGQSNSVSYTQNKGELKLLEEEVKVSCTQGLLICLKESARITYILGEILEFSSTEGAEILGISPENFRKQLSRSREKIRNFLTQKCGIANPNNPCRCNKKIDFLINQDIINPNNLKFAHLTKRSIDLVDKISDMEKSVAIYRSTPNANTPSQVLNNIRKTIQMI